MPASLALGSIPSMSNIVNKISGTLGFNARHFFRYFNAVHIGHGQIEQHYFGLKLSKLFEAGNSALRLSADRPGARTRHGANNAPRGIGIVDD